MGYLRSKREVVIDITGVVSVGRNHPENEQHGEEEESFHWFEKNVNRINF